MTDRIHLPTVEDGIAGLDRLADHTGIANLHGWLRMIRQGKSPMTDLLNAWLVKASAGMVLAVMDDDPDLSFNDARRKIADQLGYDLYSRPKFYEWVRAGRAMMSREDQRRLQ